MNEKQSRFAFCIADFLCWLRAEGYWAVFGEGYRPHEVAQYYAAHNLGIENSLHELRLAHDLFLFFGDGKPLTTFEQYLPAGEQWEKMDPLARWGGRFKKLDCGHFSFEHNGVR